MKHLRLRKDKRVTRRTQSIRFSDGELIIGKAKAKKWAAGNFSDFVRAAVRNYEPAREDLEHA